MAQPPVAEAICLHRLRRGSLRLSFAASPVEDTIFRYKGEAAPKTKKFPCRGRGRGIFCFDLLRVQPNYPYE